MIVRGNIMKQITKSNSMEMKLLTYISQTLSFISMLLTILSFYGYSSTKNKIIYLILSILFFIITFFIIINRKNISKRILVFILNKTVSSQNIEILDKTVVYEHLERYRFKFQSLFSINVVGNTPINSHLERLKWSAGFIPEVVAVKQNQKIEYDKDPLSYNQIEKQNINIIFPNGKTISKNDEPYRTGFKILNLYDEKHISKPILVVGIYNITKNLTLKVYFPENLSPIEIRGLKYAHFIDEEPYDSIPLKLQHDDENNKYYVEFFIKTPIYGGKYAIDWGFND